MISFNYSKRAQFLTTFCQVCSSVFGTIETLAHARLCVYICDKLQRNTVASTAVKEDTEGDFGFL